MRKRIVRLCVGISALLVIGVLGIVGSTYSWNAHKVEQENNIQSRNTGVAVVENFPNQTIVPDANRVKEVAFENTGTSAVFLRVAMSERWETDSEIILGAAYPSKDRPANFSTYWEYSDPATGGDGWYYYKYVVPRGVKTENILNSVTFPTSCPAGADYLLDFIVETVQASNENVVNAAATQAVFGREGTITGMTTINGAVTGGSVNWN